MKIFCQFIHQSIHVIATKFNGNRRLWRKLHFQRQLSDIFREWTWDRGAINQHAGKLNKTQFIIVNNTSNKTANIDCQQNICVCEQTYHRQSQSTKTLSTHFWYNYRILPLIQSTYCHGTFTKCQKDNTSVHLNESLPSVAD